MSDVRVNNATLEVAVGALNASPPSDGRLKGRAMMDLYKTTRPLADALAPYLTAKQAVFAEFGTLGPDGQYHVDREITDDGGNTVPNPRWDEFKAEYEEILGEDVEFGVVPLPAYLLDILEFDPVGWAALIKIGVVSMDDPAEEEEKDAT